MKAVHHSSLPGRISGAALAALWLALLAPVGSAAALEIGSRTVERVSNRSHSGPYCGLILALAADPRDANVLYAGTENGLFRSADAGGSWTLLLGGNVVDGVYVSPSDSSVLLASVAATSDEIFPYDSEVSYLFRSADSGATWVQVLEAHQQLSIGTSIGRFYASDNSASPFDPSFAAVSTDDGASWAPLPRAAERAIAVDSVVNTRVYLLDWNGTVEVSLDGGSSWQATPLQNAGVNLLQVDPSSPLTVYASGDVFFRSDDGGSHWSPNRWAGAPIVALAVSERTLYAATAAGDVYGSANRGDTWARVGAVPGGLLSLLADQDALLAGADGAGVLRSDDGGRSWSPRNGHLDAAPIGAVAVAPSAPGTVYALTGGFAKTTDGGQTWSLDAFAPSAAAFGGLAVDPTDSRIVYASDATAGVIRSGDGGTTWSPPSATGRFVTSIAVSPAVPSTVYMADGQPWKSTDGGETWIPIHDGIGDGVDFVVVDPTAADTLYATNGEIYRSDNAGDQWELATAQSLGYVTALVPDPAHPGTIYAIAFSDLYKSEDRGKTWSLELLQVIAAAVDDRGVVSVGTADGPSRSGTRSGLPPLRSTDGGATWQQLCDWGRPDGPGAIVTSLATDNHGFLYAGTSTNGVWRIGSQAPLQLAPR